MSSARALFSSDFMMVELSAFRVSRPSAFTAFMSLCSGDARGELSQPLEGLWFVGSPGRVALAHRYIQISASWLPSTLSVWVLLIQRVVLYPYLKKNTEILREPCQTQSTPNIFSGFLNAEDETKIHTWRWRGKTVSQQKYSHQPLLTGLIASRWGVQSVSPWAASSCFSLYFLFFPLLAFTTVS